MKKILLLALLAMNFPCFSQQDPAAEILQRIQHIPAFSLLKVPDSTVLNSSQLLKKKPTVVMFFNPDCEHCQRETKELLAYREELKPLQLVMLSAASYTAIKDFYTEYNIASMSNVTMGRDVDYAAGLIFRPKIYPAIFVYDAAGNLAKVFVGNVAITSIIDAVK